MKQCYIRETDSFVNVETVGERSVYFEGEEFNMSDYHLLDLDQRNDLDNALDNFEDGGNKLVNGYEFYSYGDFTICREVKIIKDEDLTKTQQLIEAIRADCKYFKKIKNRDGFVDNYLFLSECHDSDSIGLYQLILNGQELHYGTLNEINTIVKAMIRVVEIGFS